MSLGLPVLTRSSLPLLSLACASGVLGSAEPAITKTRFHAALAHGDVVVWGGAARLHHHGVLPLKDGEHPVFGRPRLNLILRRAL